MENNEKESLVLENGKDDLRELPGEGMGVPETAQSEENIVSAADKYANFAREESIDARQFSLEEEDRMGNNFTVDENKKRDLKSLLSGHKRSLLIALAMLAVLGVMAAAYMLLQKDESPVPGNQNNGEVIVKSAIDAMKKVGSYNYEGKMNFDFEIQEKDSLVSSERVAMGINISTDGVTDYRSAENPSFYTSIAMDIDGKSPAMDIDGKSPYTEIKMKLDGELASLDKVVYVKLNDISVDNEDVSDGSKRQMEGFVEIIKNNWYFISEEDLKKLYAEAGVDISSLEQGAFSKESMQRFNKIINNYDLLKFSQDLGDEKVGEVDAYHYRVKVDSREAFEMAIDLIEESLRSQGNEEEAKSFMDKIKNSTEDIDKAKEIVDFVLNEMNAEVWIGKNDNLIYRAKIEGKFDKDFFKAFMKKYDSVYGNGEAYDEEDLDQVGKINVNFGMDYTFSNFDTAFVRKPEGAKDFQKIRDAFIAQMESSVAGNAGGADTDGDGLSNEMEKFYGSDPAKADTDGDGYKDGDEVNNGYDPTVAGSARLDYNKLFDIK